MDKKCLEILEFYANLENWTKNEETGENIGPGPEKARLFLESIQTKSKQNPANIDISKSILNELNRINEKYQLFNYSGKSIKNVLNKIKFQYSALIKRFLDPLKTSHLFEDYKIDSIEVISNQTDTFEKLSDSIEIKLIITIGEQNYNYKFINKNKQWEFNNG